MRFDNYIKYRERREQRERDYSSEILIIFENLLKLKAPNSSFLGWGSLLSLLCLGSSVECEVTVVITYLLDEILRMEISEHSSGNSTIYLEFIADNGNCENQEFGCLLHDSIV